VLAGDSVALVRRARNGVGAKKAGVWEGGGGKKVGRGLGSAVAGSSFLGTGSGVGGGKRIAGVSEERDALGSLEWGEENVAETGARHVNKLEGRGGKGKVRCVKPGCTKLSVRPKTQGKSLLYEQGLGKLRLQGDRMPAGGRGCGGKVGDINTRRNDHHKYEWARKPKEKGELEEGKTAAERMRA